MRKLFILICLIGLPCYSMDCTRIPDPTMPNYIQYIDECKAEPKLKQFEFSESVALLNPIWTNYKQIANDKYSYTDQANYVKEKTYTYWLYSMIGSQLWEHVAVENIYGLMTNLPLLEQAMNKLYEPFPKLGHLLQREYMEAFINLGEQCIKYGKFPTQMERDVYTCHCLYLLRATTDRHAYYQLYFHIKHVTPGLVKEGSLYTLPEIKKFVKEQINLKEKNL